MRVPKRPRAQRGYLTYLMLDTTDILFIKYLRKMIIYSRVSLNYVYMVKIEILWLLQVKFI